MTRVDLDALEALLAKTTPLPWGCGGSTPTPGESWIWEETGHHPGDPDAPDTRIACCGHDDARAITALRNWAPALIAELRMLRRLECVVVDVATGPTEEKDHNST